LIEAAGKDVDFDKITSENSGHMTP